MQLAAQGLDQPADTAPVEGDPFANQLSMAIGMLMARRRTRQVVQGLSDAQLRDIGIDRVVVLGNRPVIEHDVRLATYLASLR